ncbi:MAG TPA: GNAT family N-acetyltransferase [Candidatus Udaeobacter sp.]|jgi:RimJ/RimL family protein N-acetyltransferase|nr:GNAT family N-acetyltransferase [Candidatus Udaeobacter sp.]
MQLILESCTIRPWRLSDAKSLAKHANNRKVWLGLRDLFPHPYTIRDAQDFLERTLSDEVTTKFCIEINNSAVGGMGIHPGQDVHSHTATLGYWLGEDFWGRGIMTHAVSALTDFWLQNLPVRRISAEVFSNNPASARVLEKAGFVFEGRLKNCVIKNEELLDSLLYAKTR